MRVSYLIFWWVDVQGIGGDVRRISVYNDSATEWHNVEITLNQKLRCLLPIVEANGHGRVNFPNCEGNVPSNEQIYQISLKSNEGRLLLEDGKAVTTFTTRPPANTINAHAKISAGLGPLRSLKVTNLDSEAWTNCTVIVNNDYRKSMPYLAAGRSDGIMLGLFEDDTGRNFISNGQLTRIDIQCTQGNAIVRP